MVTEKNRGVKTKASRRPSDGWFFVGDDRAANG